MPVSATLVSKCGRSVSAYRIGDKQPSNLSPDDDVPLRASIEWYVPNILRPRREATRPQGVYGDNSFMKFDRNPLFPSKLKEIAIAQRCVWGPALRIEAKTYHRAGEVAGYNPAVNGGGAHLVLGMLYIS